MPGEGHKRKLDFVVLTWNSGDYVESCLSSILAIDSFDICLHVIDNGSTDGTVELLDVYKSVFGGRMDAIKIGFNLGTTASRNIAFRSIDRDVDYVCVLDSDTVVNETALMLMSDVLYADSSIGIVGPTMRSSSGEEQLSGRNLPTASLKLRKACPFGRVSERAALDEVPTSPVVDGLQDVGYLLSACWFMPRRIIDEVGLLDEKIFYAPEDVDYCVRVHKAGYRVVRCMDAEIVHEYQRISRRKLISKTNLEHIKGLAHYFRKHRRPPDVGAPAKKG